MTHYPAVVSDLGALRVVQLREVWLDDPIDFGDLAQMQLSFEVANVAFQCTICFAHMFSTFSNPVIVQLAEQALHFGRCLFAISLVGQQEEHRRFWHFELYPKALWPRAMPNRQLISNQLKMVLKKPASGFEDPLVFFNCLSMSIIVLSNVLNDWHELLTNDFEYLTQKELVNFEWIDYSFLYGLHCQR